MLTTDNYECTWDLYKTIPSLNHSGKSVFDENRTNADEMKNKRHIKIGWHPAGWVASRNSPGWWCGRADIPWLSASLLASL